MSRLSWNLRMLVAIGISVISACQSGQDTFVEHQTAVEFLVDVSGSNASGAALKALGNLEDATALVVSIEDASGAVVYDSERVELYNFDGTHLSHPLSLLPGSYALTEFLVVDASDSVRYATPLDGSETAYLVAEPLAITFDVSKDGVTTIRPEVLSTEEHTPEDFGYASFEPVVVDVLDFLIAVFIYDDTRQELALTEAHLRVTNEGGEELYAGNLGSVTTHIIVQDGHAQYTLEVEKSGYEKYVQTLTADELASYFHDDDNGPMTVVLAEKVAPVQIPQGDGQPIGNMTYYGPVSTAFDGNYDDAYLSSACGPFAYAGEATVSHIGKIWGQGRTVRKVRLIGLNDYPYYTGQTQFVLQGSNDGSTWVSLFTSEYLTVARNSDYEINEGVVTDDEYMQHRVTMNYTGGWSGSSYCVSVKEVEFFE